MYALLILPVLARQRGSPSGFGFTRGPPWNYVIPAHKGKTNKNRRKKENEKANTCIIDDIQPCGNAIAHSLSLSQPMPL